MSSRHPALSVSEGSHKTDRNSVPSVAVVDGRQSRGDNGSLLECDCAAFVGDVMPVVHKDSPIIQASAFALETLNDRVFRYRNFSACPCLLGWTMDHIVRGECRDVVGVQRVQPRLGRAACSLSAKLLNERRSFLSWPR